MNTNKKLTSKQLKAIQLMITTNLQNKEIQKKLDISSPNTLTRWMNDPVFKQRLEQEQEAYFNNLQRVSIDFMNKNYIEATKVISDLLHDTTDKKYRYNCAKDILTLAYRIDNKEDKELLNQLAENLEKIEAFKEVLPYIPKEVLKEFDIN